ncbi:Odorant-binding protein 50a, isoform B [Drosophila ananassae]|uniref:Odorant-binding protein 50a, isoform B n=1 Tax=Drosophila ananassae TaxID=7217 RepID=A0A0P8Y632_DROAN|nr:uncharacterized protein LOC6494218 isoform X1 [Drosophila ananassae]KPU76910.1 Odorant-binding protein 50a, isoform B [Drosophila ananassae]
MYMGRILVVCLLGYTVLVEAAKCKAAPKSVQNVNICCSAPMPNWGVYNRECAASGSQASVSGRIVYLPTKIYLTYTLLQCRLSCIFNVSSALKGTSLIQAKIRPMLERAFTSDVTIDIYETNLAKCSAVVKSKYPELGQLSRQSNACDRHALFYSLCAYARLIFTCPEKMWQRSNRMCQEARSYAKNCPWPALKMFMKNT